MYCVEWYYMSSDKIPCKSLNAKFESAHEAYIDFKIYHTKVLNNKV
jgi:hypothetical protein